MNMNELNEKEVLQVLSVVEKLIATRDRSTGLQQLCRYIGSRQRAFIGRLFDAPWSGDELKDKTLTRVVVAQLGNWDPREDPEFMVLVGQMTVKKLLPKLLRELVRGYGRGEKISRLLEAATQCENDGDIKSVDAATEILESINDEIDGCDFEVENEWTEVGYGEILASQLRCLVNYCGINYAHQLAAIAVAAGEEIDYEILNEYVNDVFEISLKMQFPGAKFLYLVE